ncbi:hypothetical protein MPTK1_6g16190 [Marchantia polymorpha subsp. ruderalis]|uniref:BURP domain-containing protein n=2 Tax=Marchantia polymorpha TaxID=3197 RepID=A0AAF6BSL8_MARPO|nr:hypothetical protein MARPO_0056s0129 [Marchantia polymorpha]BBN15002.1 hypothetical protein Mp_6g16190 [Marchantia polymorpha subsp. ruderalis]|eukprot:PTQ37686.1 hypothetical protein MARPO_0056s0129 [Marchantia polymorpha]
MTSPGLVPMHFLKKTSWTFYLIITFFSLAADTTTAIQISKQWMIPSSFQQLLPIIAADPHAIKHIQRGELFGSQEEVLRFCEGGGLVCDADTDDIYQSAIWYYYRGGKKISKLETTDMNTAINPRLATFMRQFYFFEKDLPALVLRANFLQALSNDSSQARYLPKSVVQLLLSSTQNFSNGAAPAVLHHFQISSDSEMGKTVSGTIEACSPTNMVNRAVEGEVRRCLYSMEDLIDFAQNALNATPDRTRPAKLQIVDSEPFETTLTVQEIFKVVNVELKSDEDTASLNCHTLGFPFRVNMCHMLPKTKVYVATLESTERPGYVIKHPAICHMKTSGFGADQVGFMALGTKPGESEICHWMEVGAFAVVQVKE